MRNDLILDFIKQAITNEPDIIAFKNMTSFCFVVRLDHDWYVPESDTFVQNVPVNTTIKWFSKEIETDTFIKTDDDWKSEHDYNLDFASKRYINWYLPYLLFEGIYIHCEMKRNIIDNDGKKVKVVFYFFTRHDNIPERLFTTEAWQNVYENFRCLRSNRNNTNTQARWCYPHQRE